MIEWRLHLRMAERRLKLKDVAEITGLAKPTISKIFHGTEVKGVDIHTLDVLCKTLGCQSITEIMEYVPDQT